MATHLLVRADSEQVALTARDWLVARIQQAIAENQFCVIAASGGSTPKRLYELLAQLPDHTLDWSKIHLIWGDERNVPLDHVDSNFRMVRTALLGPLGRSGPNVYPVPIDPENPEESARYYESTLRSLFGHRLLGDFPRIDIALLGVGDDAHTASLFPNSLGLMEKEKWVVSHWVQKLSSYRITLTSPVFNAAANIAFLVCGASKRHALQQIWHEAFEPLQYPTQLIQPTDGDVWWIADQAAVEGIAPPVGALV